MHPSCWTFLVNQFMLTPSFFLRFIPLSKIIPRVIEPAYRSNRSISLCSREWERFFIRRSTACEIYAHTYHIIACNCLQCTVDMSSRVCADETNNHWTFPCPRCATTFCQSMLCSDFFVRRERIVTTFSEKTSSRCLSYIPCMRGRSWRVVRFL